MTIARPGAGNAITDPMSAVLAGLVREAGADAAVNAALPRGGGADFRVGRERDIVPPSARRVRLPRDGGVPLVVRSEADQNGPMAGLAFDTLAAARRLKKVGMEESHAEAVAESLRDAVTGSVATKQDLDAAKWELREEITGVKAEITAVKAEVRGEIAAFKAEIRGEIAAFKAEVREEIAAVKAETKAIKWVMVSLLGLMLMVVGRIFEIL